MSNATSSVLDVASTLQLPAGAWETLLEGLCAHFPRISPEQWQDRFNRGRVLDVNRQPLAADAPYRVGTTVHYFREIVDELLIPFLETILYQDEHLLVVDKPHFLPAAPTGIHVRETLLGRLAARLQNPGLVPLHRLDRGTAGVMMFSVDPRTRNQYQALFRERRIDKRYEAIAPALPDGKFPLLRESRIEKSEPFFRMGETDGASNARTRVWVIDANGPWWRYGLAPVTGRKHQLRVHMAGLGAPIRNDRYYPLLLAQSTDDYSRPLQLLASRLAFIDPLSGLDREFTSQRELQIEPLTAAS